MQSPAPVPLVRIVLGAALIVAAMQLLLLVTSNAAVLQGQLFDPDSYLHLERARQMLIDGPAGDPRLNAPFGFSIHWTRLFDGLLAAGAMPLLWFGLDLRQALFVWGSVISPLLLVAALAAFAWGTRPLLPGWRFLWLTVLIFIQPQLSGAFLAGRPDHQSLVTGLLLVQMAWAFAVMDGRAGRIAALLAGVAAGLQLCTSVEALLSLGVIGASLLIGWAWLRRPVLAALALYGAGAFGTVLLYLGLAHSFAPAYDRVSIVHLVVLGGGLGGLALLGLASRLTGISRALLLAPAFLAAALPVLCLYPAFFAGPWADIDPVLTQWHRGISELQPLWPASFRGFWHFLVQFAAPLIALPLAIARLRTGPATERTAMLVCLVGFAVFGALSLYQMRWSREMQVAMLLPFTLTTLRLWASTRHWGPIALRGPLLASVLLVQLTPGLLAPSREIAGLTTRSACDWSAAATALGGRFPPDIPGGVLLTQLWYGPEILWRSGLDVVGGPYEMAPAIADTWRFEQASAAQARAVLIERRVGHVLTCGARADAAVLGLAAEPFSVAGFALYRVRP